MIKYIADSMEWLDKVNGNTYASTRIISDVGIAWVRSIQHRKLKPEQIPEKVRIFADWISTPEGVQS